MNVFKGKHFKELFLGMIVLSVRREAGVRRFYCFDYIIFANIFHCKKNNKPCSQSIKEYL